MLENSVVVPEPGPAGVVVRIQHADGRIEYGGPIPDETLEALREESK